MSYSENNSFTQILQRLLENPILETVDKRQGSVIYDTLAPVALELSTAYAKMDILEEQTYLLTAVGDKLDLKAFDYGEKRDQATNAVMIADYRDKDNVEMTVAVGNRFSSPETGTTYIVIESKDGYQLLQAEQTGTIGNSYLGLLLPLQGVNNLATATITGVYTPANDTETDEELRNRIFEKLNAPAYGGNVQDYINKTKEIDGVGDLKVFPAWQGGGSVLLSVVDDNANPISEAFINQLKEEIDPVDGNGLGIAPIGHIVTVTTPVEQTVNLSMIVTPEGGTTIDQLKAQIEQVLADYFQEVRGQFAQDETLGIYRARIIDRVIDIPQVVNITDVMLNGLDADIIFEDEGVIGRQYLPLMGEITYG